MRSLLASHIAEARRRFIRADKRIPKTLALGRWDARELARDAALTAFGGAKKPSAFLREARGGCSAWGAEIKVDGRVGRMPGGLWWQ
jgi:hypothetical protein